MKFICKVGHCHKVQWRADNCATGKRNERRRLERFIDTPAFKEMIACLRKVAFSKFKFASSAKKIRGRR